MHELVQHLGVAQNTFPVFWIFWRLEPALLKQLHSLVRNLEGLKLHIARRTIFSF